MLRPLKPLKPLRATRPVTGQQAEELLEGIIRQDMTPKKGRIRTELLQSKLKPDAYEKLRALKK